MRDGHLRSAYFFDAERFPLMTFVSSAVRLADGAKVIIADQVDVVLDIDAAALPREGQP